MGALFDWLGQHNSDVREWATLALFAVTASAAVWAALKSAQSARAATRQAVISERQVLPSPRIDLRAPSGGSRRIRYHNDGPGRALAVRATLKLELVSAHPELTGDVKVEREQEAQIAGALPPGDATDLWWVGFVSATPNFVGADGEAAYDYVSFSAALSDQADSVNFPISFGLTLRGLQPPQR